MATTCSYVRLAMGGLSQPTLATTSVNPSSWLLAKVTGPATSVSDGMTCDVSADLQTHCYAVAVMGRSNLTTVAYDWEGLPPASYTSSQVAFRVRRCSTGALLTAATDLSGQSFMALFIGY